MKDGLDYILEAAKTNPNGVAIIDGDRTVTYHDFHELVLLLAGGLMRYGPKPKVAFDLVQGAEAYALEIAVLYLGGSFCPLNYAAPIERKEQMVGAFGPNVVVVGGHVLAGQYGGSTVSSVSELRGTVSAPGPQRADVDPEALAYVIFTSGSTGIPKGVEILRKGLNKFLEWSIPAYGATANDRWAQFSLLSFDLSIVDIFTCLGSGATLVTVPEGPSKLRPTSLIEERAITIWHSVPSVIEFMISRNNARPVSLSSLRLMSFCGEPLKMHHLDFLFSKNAEVKVFNTYGPTEGTLFCTCQELSANDYKNHCRTSASIGLAIPGWHLHRIPLDDTGLYEVVIYGDFIGRGYLGNPEINGFSVQEIAGCERRTFHTGDLIAEDQGDFYFQGRKDRQVKLKGYRVELGEIDFWINEHTGLASATVKTGDGLYSFIESTEPIADQDLRQFLATRLEEYKLPRAFVPMAALPRNVNMKIDYTALMKLQP